VSEDSRREFTDLSREFALCGELHCLVAGVRQRGNDAPLQLK